MPFHSILFHDSGNRDESEPTREPDFFHDLNLDQVVERVTAGFEEYDLAGFFYIPLRDPDAVRYRQEVMRELERNDLRSSVRDFSEGMRGVRARLDTAGKAHYPLFGDRWFLEAASLYCDTVEGMASALAESNPTSRGVRALLEHLSTYVRSTAFTPFATEARRLLSELASIRYCILVDGNSVTVRPFLDEDDYSSSVESTFERFRQLPTEDYLSSFPESVGANHVTAEILEGVARLNPEVFDAMAAFRSEHAAFIEDTVARFDREVQFYMAYLAHVDRLREAGSHFCYPQLARTPGQVYARGSYDLALAATLLDRQGRLVPNDFSLEGPERILVVTGPNQGGKTTFARAFGQMHHLAALGCLVPGIEACLFLCDRVFTHFERREEITNLRGKLQDDLVRMHHILAEATSDSLVIVNEAFTSTTLEDALLLSTKVMERLSSLGALGVWVTFLTELASHDEHTVSMVGGVDPSDPAIRTYEIEKRPADGLAYALAIAGKYRVTYQRIVERMGSPDR